MQLAPDGSGVLASFAHVPSGTAEAAAFEACAYAADSGAQLWCTTHKIEPPAADGTRPVVNAREGDRAVFGVAGVGILALDAAAKAAPPVDLIYGGGVAGDCCAATALAAVGIIAVASIPYGTRSGVWCQCEHLELVGVALVKSTQCTLDRGHWEVLGTASWTAANNQ